MDERDCLFYAIRRRGGTVLITNPPIAPPCPDQPSWRGFGVPANGRHKGENHDNDHQPDASNANPINPHRHLDVPGAHHLTKTPVPLGGGLYLEEHMTLNDIRLQITPKPPSRSKMSELMGITRVTYSKWEDSIKCPRVFLLAAWAVRHQAPI